MADRLPVGLRTWMSWSPRRRWFVSHYSGAVVILPSLVVSVVQESWPTILTNAIILGFLVIGDLGGRYAWRDGYDQGVSNTLDVLAHQSRQGEPSFLEFHRLITSTAPPWRDPIASDLPEEDT